MKFHYNLKLNSDIKLGFRVQGSKLKYDINFKIMTLSFIH
jgi:hypothetical protein